MHDTTYDPYTQMQRYQHNYHPPYYYTTFGKVNQRPTSLRLQHFTQVYRSKVASEWCPVGPLKPLPIRAIQPLTIYYGNIGLLPNYSGHVPGRMFRYGKTYGEDTKDAKAWFRDIRGMDASLLFSGSTTMEIGSNAKCIFAPVSYFQNVRGAKLWSYHNWEIVVTL